MNTMWRSCRFFGPEPKRSICLCTNFSRRIPFRVLRNSIKAVAPQKPYLFLSTRGFAQKYQEPSQSPKDAEPLEIPLDDKGRAVIYEGNLASSLKRIKRLSLVTSVMGLALIPKIVYSAEQNSIIVFIVVTLGTSVFTFITPILINLLCKRYVTELLYAPETDMYTLRTYNFFGFKNEVDFQASEIYVPDVPIGPFTNMYLRRKTVSNTLEKRPLFMSPPCFIDPSHYARFMKYDKPIDFHLETPPTAESTPESITGQEENDTTKEKHRQSG